LNEKLEAGGMSLKCFLYKMELLHINFSIGKNIF